MDKDKGNIVTEQGIGNPVPVGRSGANAGSPRPLPSDRGASSVMNQAKRAGRATGTETEEDLAVILLVDVRMFQIHRQANLRLIKGKVARKKKRQKESLNEKEKQHQKKEDKRIFIAVKETPACDKLRKAIANLVILAKQNVNTKVEIKRGIEEASRELRGLERYLTDIAHKSEENTEETETEKINSAVQTDPIEIVDKSKVQSIQISTEQMDELSRKQTFEDFEKIAWEEWPGEAYRRTNTKEGNPLKGEVNADVGIVIGNRDNKEKGLARFLHERFPEIGPAEETHVDDSDNTSIACVVNTVGLIDKEGECMRKEKWIYRLCAGEDGDPSSRAHAKQIFKLMAGLRQNMEKITEKQ